MAKTTFTVTLLKEIYEKPYGFYVDLKSTGGVNTAGTIDPADDVTVAPIGVEGGNEERGFWVDLKNPFDCDGDVADPLSSASLLNNFLITRGYAWNPSNPAYDTVAPYEKDGVTENANFVAAQLVGPNPTLVTADASYGFGDASKAYRTMDICRTFDVVTVVTTAAAKPAARAKAKK